MTKQKRQRRTHEDLLKLIETDFNGEYEVLSEYLSTAKPVTLKHKVCGDIWSPLANNFIRKQSKCPLCSGKKKYTTKTYGEWVEKETNGEFSLIGEYRWNKEKVDIRHNVCGYERPVYPFYLNRKEFGCPRCSNMQVHNKAHVELLLDDKYGTEYQLISQEVKNNRDPILVFHVKCGQEFETSSNSIINAGKGCSHCKPSGSKGELKIEEFLNSNNIKHVREFSFVDCRNILPLLFDFAVFDYSESIKCLIEFDGKQHFEPVEFFGGEEGFNLTQIRDKIKNEYCKENGIPLIRIPYWDEDKIPQILDSEFNLLLKEVA